MTDNMKKDRIFRGLKKTLPEYEFRRETKNSPNGESDMISFTLREKSELQPVAVMDLNEALAVFKLAAEKYPDNVWEDEAFWEAFVPQLAAQMTASIPISGKAGEASDIIPTYDEVVQNGYPVIMPISSAPLNGVTVMPFGQDMAVIIKCPVPGTERGVELVVTQGALDNWGVTADRLFADVLNASQARHPFVLLGGKETYADGSGFFALVSTPEGMGGAGCMAYPDFFEDMAEEMEGSFYVFPISTRMVYVFSEVRQIPVERLEQGMRELYARDVAPEDRLSARAYHYDAKVHVFETVEEYEQRTGYERG